MKILHIAYGFNGGGVGFVIANYCTGHSMNGIQFDIVGESTGQNHLLHERFEQAGFGVHYVTPKKKSLIHNILEMKQLMKSGHYDAVHVHFEEWSFLYLGLAKLFRIPIRICHAHMAYLAGIEKKPHYKLFRALLNRWATCRIACSKDAGDYLFAGRPYMVLNNAIDAEKYIFDEDKRAQIRSEMQLEDRFVIGNVARFAFQKNPLFTIDIFKELHKRVPNAMLILVGTGELGVEVHSRVQEYGLQQDVLFLGLRTDVPDLMQAMDVFLLPSRYEGLGIAYIEAQASGLMTFGTEGVVPKEACITDRLMKFLPLEDSAARWADEILSAPGVERINTQKLIQSKGYDLSTEITKLEKLYLRHRIAGGSDEFI